MARRAHAYPQVAVTAADAIDSPVASAPAGISSRAALGLARARGAEVVALAGRRPRFVLREDLARAAALALDDLPAAALARPLATVEATAGEARLRRRPGARVAVVSDRGRWAGTITTAAAARVALGVRFTRALPDAARAALAAVGEEAAARGARAFAVGGLVRDVLGGGGLERVDLDVAVEGDGVAVARALAARLGGEVIEHRRFLTASVTGIAAGRLDVATCRSERYEVRGALPRVMPSTVAEDLRRRDFTVNALAVELDAGVFELLDPHGGRADLERRRLRVLHPLSFVEDPTRVFRAARYAERLGLRLDAWTAGCQALALRLVPYPALSGERIAAELERTLDEPRAAAVLARLGRAGAFRLLDARYRFTRATAADLARLPEGLAWLRARETPAPALELAALAVVASQPPAVAEACLRRLAFSGEPLVRLVRALGETPGVAARLAAASGPAARARVLADRGAVERGWLWLRGDLATRGHLEWFVERARSARPELRGEDVIALGVARGPAVARVLAGLREARLEGAVGDRAAESAYVRAWVRAHDADAFDAKEG